MPVPARNLCLGIIVYFRIDRLRAEPGIRRTGGSADPKLRPFLCYAVDGSGESYWTPLTTDDGQPGRIVLESSWIQNATGRLSTERQMLNDGGHTYAGPVHSFAARSHEDLNAGPSWPVLLPDGITFILPEIRKRGGLLPKEATPEAARGV